MCRDMLNANIPRWMSVSTGDVTLFCVASSSFVSAASTSSSAVTGLQFHLSYWNWYWHSTSPSLAPSSTHGIASGLRRQTSSCWSTNPGRRPHISPAAADDVDDDNSDCRCEPGRVIGAVDDIAVWRPMYLYISSDMQTKNEHYHYGCLGGAVVGRRTRDRKVAGSASGRSAIKSTIGQLSLPSLWVGKSSTSLYGWG